jgi:hypothetical protein
MNGFRELLDEIAKEDVEVITYTQFLDKFPDRIVKVK